MALSASAPLAMGRLVLFPGGGFAPARVRVIPTGTRLPEGALHLAPVMLTAPRGAVAMVRGMEAAGDGLTADEDTIVSRVLEAQRIHAMSLLLEVAPPPHLVDQAQKLKADLDDAIATAKTGKPDNKDCAIKMVRLAYAIADLAYKAYPVAGMPPLPEEDKFLALCFGGELDEADKTAASLLGQGMVPLDFGPGICKSDADRLMMAVLHAMNMATCASRTARSLFTCGGSDAAGMPHV